MKNIFINTLVIASVIFVSRYLYKSWPLIVSAKLKINLGWFVIVTIFLVGQHFLYVFIWKRLLAHLEVNFSYIELFKIHFSTLLIKYIPGKILFPFSRGYFIKNKGVSVQHATSIILIDLILGLVSALIIVIVFFLPYKLNNVFIFSSSCLPLYVPMFLGFLWLSYQQYKRPFKKYKISNSRLPFAKIVLQYIPFYLFLVILDGVVFYMFLNLFLPVQVEKITLFIGINSIFRTIFSIMPNQIGLSETIQVLLLKPFLKDPFLVLIPLSMRIWKIGIETALFLMTKFIFLNRKIIDSKVVPRD